MKHWCFDSSIHTSTVHTSRYSWYWYGIDYLEKYQYRGTFTLYLTTSLNFLSLLSMGRSFRLKIINIFYYWHFGFSLVKASLSSFFYCTPWILDWTLHKQVLITNPRGDLGHCRKMSQISCILFFPILNFDYLIRKVRRIHDKLWFI